MSNLPMAEKKTVVVGNGTLDTREGGDTVHAVVELHNAADLSERGRRNVANWLIEQAGFLLAEGNALAPKFTARYLSSPTAPSKSKRR